MTETEIGEKLGELEQKLDLVYQSVEKTRKYFLAIIIISIIAFVLPLIGLMFAIPYFLSVYQTLGSF